MGNTRRNARIVVIVGPTASGKTALSLKLAQKYDGEIVNADSRAIYKELDIGSAKPTKKEQSLVPHHLLDITTPDHPITLPQYKELAINCIRNIHTRDKLPFLVGGTALYIFAVVDNWTIPEVAPDAKFRMEHETWSTEQLYAKLKAIDPEAARITGKNKRRIIRALEVIEKTGELFSAKRARGPQLFNPLFIGVTPPEKEELKKRVFVRTKKMLKIGLIDEVKKLLDKGYDSTLPALSGIHYKEIIEYLDGKRSLDATIDLITKHDLALARHQMTWFKRDKRIHWATRMQQAIQLCNHFII